MKLKTNETPMMMTYYQEFAIPNGVWPGVGKDGSHLRFNLFLNPSREKFPLDACSSLNATQT